MGMQHNRRAGVAAFKLRRFTGAGKASPLLHRNAPGTAIAKLIDGTEGGTELTHKHFT